MVVIHVRELVLVKMFIQGHPNSPVRGHLFRGELKTLSRLIYAVEHE